MFVILIQVRRVVLLLCLFLMMAKKGGHCNVFSRNDVSLTQRVCGCADCVRCGVTSNLRPQSPGSVDLAV